MLLADIDERLNDFKYRIKEVCKIQEGDEPQFDINEFKHMKLLASA